MTGPTGTTTVPEYSDAAAKRQRCEQRSLVSECVCMILATAAARTAHNRKYMVLYATRRLGNLRSPTV